MVTSVNLLPWRLSGRRQRLRLRVGVMVSVLILLVSLFWGGGRLLSQKMAVLQKQGNELESQHRALQLILQHQQPLQPRGDALYQSDGGEIAQQYRVSRWGKILYEVASKLPENSWLRSLSWQSGVLTLEGFTPEIEELEGIETGLKQLPGAFHVKAGTVSYQANQGLAYRFILVETGGEIVSP